VAAVVAERLLQAAQSRPGRALGLATGRTMEPVYAALVQRVEQLPQAAAAALRDHWLSFNLDEYVGLGPGDPGSFAAEMERRLRRPLNLDPASVRLPDGLHPDPAAAAALYRQALLAAGGIGLQLLGLGLNGHVGFNEPPCGPELCCRCLALSPATRQQNAAGFGGDAAAVPARAITLGLREILAAQELLLVVTGAAKAAVLERLWRLPASPALPASWLRGHPGLVLVADEAALGLVSAGLPG
jgi:glucosamine-6-phosphate deaminase